MEKKQIVNIWWGLRVANEISIKLPAKLVGKWLDKGVDWMDLEIHLSPQVYKRVKKHIGGCTPDEGDTFLSWGVSERVLRSHKCFFDPAKAKQGVKNPCVFRRTGQDRFQSKSLKPVFRAWSDSHPVSRVWTRAE